MPVLGSFKLSRRRLFFGCQPVVKAPLVAFVLVGPADPQYVCFVSSGDRWWKYWHRDYYGL